MCACVSYSNGLLGCGLVVVVVVVAVVVVVVVVRLSHFGSSISARSVRPP